MSDRQEVMGEYLLQFGKYQRKSFKWLLENDVGYTMYLMKKVDEEERAGTAKKRGQILRYKHLNLSENGLKVVKLSVHAAR